MANNSLRYWSRQAGLSNKQIIFNNHAITFAESAEGTAPAPIGLCSASEVESNEYLLLAVGGVPSTPGRITINGITQTLDEQYHFQFVPTADSLVTFNGNDIEIEEDLEDAILDLRTLSLSPGTHSITVIAASDSYRDSAFSDAVTYVVSVQLTAPTIDISDNLLTITNTDVNSEQFAIYADGVLKDTTARTGLTTTFDLTGLDLEVGTYTITCKAMAAQYRDSDFSNGESYEKVMTQLTAPSISLEGIEILNIVDHDNNTQRFGIYDGDTLKGIIQRTSDEESWKIKDVITLPSTQTVYRVNFRSNGISFDQLIFKVDQIIYHRANSTSGHITVYQNGTWAGEDYKSIVLLRPATGDLYTWLQTNALWNGGFYVTMTLDGNMVSGHSFYQINDSGTWVQFSDVPWVDSSITLIGVKDISFKLIGWGNASGAPQLSSTQLDIHESITDYDEHIYGPYVLTSDISDITINDNATNVVINPIGGGSND